MIFKEFWQLYQQYVAFDDPDPEDEEYLPWGNNSNLEHEQTNCFHYWKRENGFRFDVYVCSKCGATKDLEDSEK